MTEARKIIMPRLTKETVVAIDYGMVEKAVYTALANEDPAQSWEFPVIGYKFKIFSHFGEGKGCVVLVEPESAPSFWLAKKRVTDSEATCYDSVADANFEILIFIENIGRGLDA